MTDLQALFGRRLFTPIFLVRRHQIEKNREQHAGENEEGLVTPARLRQLRGLVADCFPAGRVSWSLSRGALLTDTAHWREVREVLAEFVHERGDVVLPNPCSGYTILYNRSEVVEAELRELIDAIGAWLGRPPRAVHAWVLLARTIAAVHREYGLDAVSGHCWSQFGIDQMSMEGSVAYPYYPSRRHVLVPGRDAADEIDVPLLDVITMDPVTARLPRKKARRQCRMGLQLLETVNYHRIGPEDGVRALKAVAATHLTGNHGNLPFSWITTTQELVEVFREDFSFACYRQWWQWLAETYADLEVLTTPEFGRGFRASYRHNTWRYHLHAAGTGVGLSDPDLAVDWVFCKDYRSAQLVERGRRGARARLIDFVDYHQEVAEPEGPCGDISLRASPWQKKS